MTRQQNPSKALLLSLIPGLGQIYNKQKAQGVHLLRCDTGLSNLFLCDRFW